MVEVPCNGCTACCRYDMIFLHPERGDLVATYETEMAIDPRDGLERPVLKHKPDGGCVYLGDKGCTIHARAPVICKEFDCRRFYQSLPRAERRRLLKLDLISKDVLEAGRLRTPVFWGSK